MKNWKTILGVVAVFVLGMLAGGLVTAKIFQHRIHQVLTGDQSVVANVIVRRLCWRLRLDATQREQLRAIVSEAQQELKTVRKQVQPQVEEILDRAVAKERATLRPEQVEKFDRLVAERKTKWKEQ
jgi:hypothetical protein